jgi:hypothetical protein
VLPYDRSILLVVEQPSQVEEVTPLLRVGFDEVQGYMEGGMDAWSFLRELPSTGSADRHAVQGDEPDDEKRNEDQDHRGPRKMHQIR